jgi:hypothetical protein
MSGSLSPRGVKKNSAYSPIDNFGQKNLSQTSMFGKTPVYTENIQFLGGLCKGLKFLWGKPFFFIKKNGILADKAVEIRYSYGRNYRLGCFVKFQGGEDEDVCKPENRPLCCRLGGRLPDGSDALCGLRPDFRDRPNGGLFRGKRNYGRGKARHRADSAFRLGPGVAGSRISD